MTTIPIDNNERSARDRESITNTQAHVEDVSVSSEIDAQFNLRLFNEAIISAFHEGGDPQRVKELFKSLQEAEIREMLQVELNNDENERDMLSRLPDVHLERPNYNELVKPHQPLDLSSFRKEARDFPALLEWSTVDGGEISSSLRGVIGSNLRDITSSKTRLGCLEELESNQQSVLTLSDIRNDSRYSEMNIRQVIEDEEKSKILQKEILEVGEHTDLRIRRYKEIRDLCQIDYKNTNDTENQLLRYKSTLEESIKCSKDVLLSYDQIQKELMETMLNKIEENRKTTSVIENIVNEQINLCSELLITLIKDINLQKPNQRKLAISRAEGVKLERLSNTIKFEMENRKHNIIRYLEEDTQANDITINAIKAHQEIICENGENITLRNIQKADRIFTLKENEGKQDFQYFKDLLLQINRYIMGNSTTIERELDRIAEDEEFLKDRLMHIDFDEYPECEKKEYQRIQGKRTVNTRNQEKYFTKEEQWESTFNDLIKYLGWTDVNELVSPFIENRLDMFATAIAMRLRNLMIKLNENFDKLYESVNSDNLDDKAADYEKRQAFYLNYIDKDFADKLDITAINRPNIQTSIQSLKDQVQLYLGKNYFENDNFKAKYELYCNNISWAAMINYHEKVVKHLDIIFPKQINYIPQTASSSSSSTSTNNS